MIFSRVLHIWQTRMYHLIHICSQGYQNADCPKPNSLLRKQGLPPGKPCELGLLPLFIMQSAGTCTAVFALCSPLLFPACHPLPPSSTVLFPHPPLLSSLLKSPPHHFIFAAPSPPLLLSLLSSISSLSSPLLLFLYPLCTFELPKFKLRHGFNIIPNFKSLIICKYRRSIMSSCMLCLSIYDICNIFFTFL